LLQCADKDANFMKTVIIGGDLQSAGTTWKQEHSHHIGRLRGLWGQKRYTKFGTRWKWCWWFSLIKKVSFTMSMHQMVKLLTRSTTLKFFIGCMMRCGANDLRHGSKVTGSCTTTTTPPTRPTLSRMSWLNIRSHRCCNPCIHRTFFCSQKWKCCWKGIDFKKWTK